MRGNHPESHAYDSADKFDATSCPATGLETGISETTKQLEEDPDNVESQIPPALNLTELSASLKNWGFTIRPGDRVLQIKWMGYWVTQKVWLL